MSKYDYAIEVLEECIKRRKTLLKSDDSLVNKKLQKRWIADLKSAIEVLRKEGK